LGKSSTDAATPDGAVVVVGSRLGGYTAAFGHTRCQITSETLDAEARGLHEHGVREAELVGLMAADRSGQYYSPKQSRESHGVSSIRVWAASTQR